MISCVAYLVMGWLQSASGSAAAGAGELFSREFRMGLIPLIPAAAIFILAICKVEVKKAMAVSIFLAFVICLVYQHRPLTETLYSMVFGYVSEDAQISKMLNGGGIQSMIKVVAVVCLSSCYSGIFEKQGFAAFTGKDHKSRRKAGAFCRCTSGFCDRLCSVLQPVAGYTGNRAAL